MTKMQGGEVLPDLVLTLSNLAVRSFLRNKQWKTNGIRLILRMMMTMMIMVVR
jgi:hypothetical protein